MEYTDENKETETHNTPLSDDETIQEKKNFWGQNVAKPQAVETPQSVDSWEQAGTTSVIIPSPVGAASPEAQTATPEAAATHADLAQTVDLSQGPSVVSGSEQSDVTVAGSDGVHNVRESLASLPSFDDEVVDPWDVSQPSSNDTDATVIVTHTVAPVIGQQAEGDATTNPYEAATDTSAFSSAPIASGVYTYETPFSQEIEANKKERRTKTLKRVGIIAGSLIAALVVVYVAVSIYFTSHFLPQTTVNGEDVSGMSITDLSSYVSSIGENYKTHVAGDGIDLTVPASDISFVYDGNAYSAQAAAQIDPWSWPLQLGKKHDYVVDKAISFNKDKLDELTGAAVDAANQGFTPPTNASMTYDQAAGKFVVVPDALGTAIDRDAVLEKVNTGVSTMQTEIALGDEQLVQPKIRKDNEKLLASISTVNAMLDKQIKLKIAGTPAEATIDKNLLASWFSLDGDVNVNVNQDAIKEWAHGALSEQLDSTGKPRTFTRADGKQITVEGGDPEYNYGWSIDSNALAETLANNLRASKTDAIDIPMLRTAASWTPGGKDWPNRYVDVDLSEQHVRMYDDANNVIWESDCVSGNPIYGGGTDTGVFFIYMKSNPMELVGLDYNGDGEPDYRTWVTYWMPFDGGEGLHDMATRYAFGGSIFTYDGSHGCVNLPYYAAEELYGLTNVGDCVVVHW